MEMMGRSAVLMRLVLVLVCDGIDCCVTCQPSCWSVPLTVDSILLLDRIRFTFATLVVDLGHLQCGSENYRKKFDNCLLPRKNGRQRCVMPDICNVF